MPRRPARCCRSSFNISEKVWEVPVELRRSRTEKEISEPSGYRPVPPHAVPDPLQQPQRSPSVPSGLETPIGPSLFVQEQSMLLTRRRIQENTGLLDQAYGDYGEIKLCSSGDV